MGYDKSEAISGLITNPVNRRDFAKRAVKTGLWAAVHRVGDQSADSLTLVIAHRRPPLCRHPGVPVPYL